MKVKLKKDIETVVIALTRNEARVLYFSIDTTRDDFGDASTAVKDYDIAYDLESLLAEFAGD